MTRNAFRFSLQVDWQIDNSFFKRPIIARTQIRPGTQLRSRNKDFGAVSQIDLTRSLVPSVAQATHIGIG